MGDYGKTVRWLLAVVVWLVATSSACAPSSPAPSPTVPPGVGATPSPGSTPVSKPTPAPAATVNPTVTPTRVATAEVSFQWLTERHEHDEDLIIARLKERLPGVIDGIGDGRGVRITYDPQRVTPDQIRLALSDVGAPVRP